MNDEQVNRFNRNVSYGKFGRTAMMLQAIKEWCVLHPGKKALLARVTGSQILTYYAGSKVFIYSPVKVPLDPTIAIDELGNDWYKTAFVKDAIAITRQAIKVREPKIETLYYDEDINEI